MTEQSQGPLTALFWSFSLHCTVFISRWSLLRPCVKAEVDLGSRLFCQTAVSKVKILSKHSEMPPLFVSIFPPKNFSTPYVRLSLSLSSNQVLTVTSQPAKFIQMATHVCIQQHRSQLLGRLTGPSRVQPPCLC